MAIAPNGRQGQKMTLDVILHSLGAAAHTFLRLEAARTHHIAQQPLPVEILLSGETPVSETMHVLRGRLRAANMDMGVLR